MNRIWYVHCLLELPDRLDTANAMLAAAIGEGTVPPGRPDLTGYEEAFFAYEGDLAVGIAAFYQPEGHDLAWLDLLFVEAEYRRRGIGSTLLSRVHCRVRELGLPKLALGTSTGNLAMQSLAGKHGLERESITFSRKVA